MERKIGEIFEFGGEWYQCVDALQRCQECPFLAHDYCTCPSECMSLLRSDKPSVIFKKLKKVGEPYKALNRLFQAYKVFTAITDVGNYDVAMIPHYNTIDIEIKQNKEDMEDLDKIKVRDYTKVEEINVMEEKKLNLKPFDIQKAREGKPVCTRDGHKARIICFDRVNARPILALIASTDGEGEDVFDYFVSGKRIANALDSDLDLMMLHEKRSGWAKVRKDINLYDTKEEADRKMIGNDEYVTAKVFWEE